MKLATRKDDSRDGQLVVVSRDLKHAVMASRITGTLQRALDDWAFMAPQLQDLYDELNHGRAPNSFPFDPDEYLSPLPRAFQRIEAGAYPAYEKRLQKARLVADAPLPEDMVPLKIAPSHALLSPRGPVSMGYPDLRTDGGGRPVSAQETDPDDFADEREAEEVDEHAKAAAPGTHRTVPVQDAAVREAAARKAAARGGLDFSAQLVAICNDLPLNLTEDEAERHLLLLGLANAWRLHVTGDPAGRGRDRGLALAPVLVTPDELGEDWRAGRIHRPLHCRFNGRSTGKIDAAADMRFDFRQLLQVLSRQAPVNAGALLCTGPVANADPDSGWTSLLEARARRIIEESSQPGPAFMQPGDRIRIDMADARGHSLFGAIEQQVVA